MARAGHVHFTQWEEEEGSPRVPHRMNVAPTDVQLRRVTERLAARLRESAGRVLDYFRQMDMNEDGRITLEEFASVLSKLRLCNAPEEARCLFEKYDTDGNQWISFQELHHQLKHRKEVLGPYSKNRRQRMLPSTRGRDPAQVAVASVANDRITRGSAGISNHSTGYYETVRCEEPVQQKAWTPSWLLPCTNGYEDQQLRFRRPEFEFRNPPAPKTSDEDWFRRGMEMPVPKRMELPLLFPTDSARQTPRSGASAACCSSGRAAESMMRHEPQTTFRAQHKMVQPEGKSGMSQPSTCGPQLHTTWVRQSKLPRAAPRTPAQTLEAISQFELLNKDRMLNASQPPTWLTTCNR
ncbi:hypothetical protein AB1Y20_019882 [Prymnesium parvum]|uniref:EF-hand domain-containing protein n=1 Tax=Prymnesium parvum TaxID=97485 RepID=A0AB34JS84_PRYPA